MSTILPLLFFSSSAPPPPPPPSDPFWNDVVLLMPLNSSAGYSCLKGRTTSTGTTLNIQTVGGFECSNTWGFVSDNSLFDLGTSDFTIECYARFSALSTRSVVFQMNNSASGSNPYFRFFMFTNDRFFLDFTQSGNEYGFIGTDPAFTFSINTWYHIAATRQGNNWSIWVDGIQRGTTTDSRSINSVGLIRILHGDIPDNPISDPVFPFDGYVHSIRLTRSCRYTASFTPPSIPFPSS